MPRVTLKLLSALSLSFSASLFGQNISSSILGTVVDPTGATIGGADVELTNPGTGKVNRATTDPAGLFRIVNLLAGNYSLNIRAKGFKNLSVTDIVVDESQAHDMGRLELSLGAITDTVSVTAQVAAVETADSERAPLLDRNQLNVEAIKGRDLMSYMKLLPGVVDTTTSRDISGGSILGGLTFSGNTGIVGFSVDGATDMDTGCSSCFAHFEPNIDAIGEVRVLTSNFAAEYGRNSGATISVTTRSGTQSFHGTGWWTHRHEDLNANQFFNNQTGQAIPRYRYNIAGWTLGGPIYIPKHLNTSKTKFFFFASQEYTRSLLNAANQYKTMPTALEKAGNYSQSFNPGVNGGPQTLIVINDPTTGQPFPGNIIPQNRINGWGQAMLNFFPVPNTFFGPGSAQYQQDNFQSEASGSHARRDDIIRGDVNLTSKLNGYFRYGHDYDFSDALYAGIQFDSAVQGHPNPGTGLVGSVNYTFSPTLVNQATYNWSYNYFSYYEENPAQVARSLADGTTGTPQAGQPLPSLFPLHPIGSGPGGNLLEGPANCSNGYCPYLPGFSFGGTPVNAASFAESNVDYINTNRIYQFSDNLTWIKGNHTIKAGLYMEHNRKLQPGSPTYTGSYSFGKDVNNPLDSGDGYANALLGNYDTYNENSGHFVYNVWYWNREFYIQDDWRVGRRLTINYGMRFYNMAPQEDDLHEFSFFNPSLYTASAVPAIYAPYCKGGNPCSGSNRVSINPLTGALAPASYIGLFVPNSGNPANGMVVDGVNGASIDTYTNKVIAPAPRIGFALDVFGDGKTALRGGWGVYFDRLDGNQVYSMSGQPPVGYQPTAYYGAISNLASAGGLIGPPGITMWSGKTPIPESRSASLGLQRNIGWGTVLDVAYQLTQGIHRYYLRNLNAIPLGADFSAQYLDPTTAISNPLNPPHLVSAFERPNYPGFGDINEHDFGAKSNYNGLQITLNHRLQHGFTVGSSFSWSRSMATSSFDPLVANNNERNYGPQSTDRRIVGAINYSYDLPKPGQLLHSRALGAITDNWTLAGITGYSTGSPFTPSFSTTNGLDITGSASEGARINIVSNPFQNVPAGTPGLPHGVMYFNPAAFAEPAVGTIGNAGVDVMYGPSYINWDMSLGKRIPLGKETRFLTLKVEAFNVFNHVQFTGVNAAFQFNATGVNTNANIGALTGERGPRVVALEMRAAF